MEYLTMNNTHSNLMIKRWAFANRHDRIECQFNHVCLCLANTPMISIFTFTFSHRFFFFLMRFSLCVCVRLYLFGLDTIWRCAYWLWNDSTKSWHIKLNWLVDKIHKNSYIWSITHDHEHPFITLARNENTGDMNWVEIFGIENKYLPRHILRVSWIKSENFRSFNSMEKVVNLLCFTLMCCCSPQMF